MAMNGVANAFGSMLGRLERACIHIEDNRIDGDIRVVEGGKGNSKLSGIAGVRVSTVKNAMGAAMDAAAGASGSLSGTGPVNYMTSHKLFMVPFNPSQLIIQAQGGGSFQVINIMDGSQGGGVNFQSVKSSIQLSVPLIFDRVYNKDAFMKEKFALNPASVISGVSAGAFNGLAGKEYTVQPEVEGFIAALRNERTRRVTFSWGSLSYTGILNSLNARYTMFSVTGKPIRAVVNIGILCVDESVEQGEMGEWQKHYEDAFVQEMSSDYEYGVQKAGNLLNLSF